MERSGDVDISRADKRRLSFHRLSKSLPPYIWLGPEPGQSTSHPRHNITSHYFFLVLTPSTISSLYLFLVELHIYIPLLLVELNPHDTPIAQNDAFSRLLKSPWRNTQSNLLPTTSHTLPLQAPSTWQLSSISSDPLCV